MRFFSRKKQDVVRAELVDGFWAAEAEAMQTVIVGSMWRAEKKREVVDAELEFFGGAEGRVVVVWRNRFVGFVPPERAPELRAQIDALPDAKIVADGQVRPHSGAWRVWVGPPWRGESPPPLPADELEPTPPSIFGIQLSGRDAKGIFRRPQPTPRTASTSPPTKTPEPAGAGPRRWILAIDRQSWEVREGIDLDVALLRRRVAAAAVGDTLHLRIGEEPVTVELHADTRITLIDGTGEDVEQLHPEP